MRRTQREERRLVVSPGTRIGQQISGSPQQRLTLQQTLMGEAIVRWTVAAGLETPQDGSGIGGRTDTQQPEMIDGQIQRPEVA